MFSAHRSGSLVRILMLLFDFVPGTVRIEMFRNMQNAEIIRKMTEEFDEVCFDDVMMRSK